MTSQGSAHGRFPRAIQTRNLPAAETAMRELGNVSLLDALDYLELLASTRPDRFDRAAVLVGKGRGRTPGSTPNHLRKA
jgi:hypothetical protein